MIIACPTHDLCALKACSLICHSWYTAAVPHLYHTLTLKGITRSINRSRLEPLSKLHKLGLLPPMKEIRVDQGPGSSCWFLPQALTRHFSALVNVHTLKLKNMGISSFIPGIKRHFRHFLPTCNLSRCTTHIVPLGNYHISSLSSQTWTTSRSVGLSYHPPTCSSPIQNSFHSSHRNYKGGWCWITLIGSKLGRTSSPRVVAYGSVTWTLLEAQVVLPSC